MSIVRHQPADQWRSLLGHDPRCTECDIRPKPLQRGEGVTGARYDEEQGRKQSSQISAARRCQRRCAHAHALEQSIEQDARDRTGSASANALLIERDNGRDVGRRTTKE